MTPTEQERQFDKAAEIEAQTPITVGATNEELAVKFRQQLLAGDGKPEGTRESLKRCADMLNTYAPELFPANEQGQVHFARAMMESVADEISAYLSTSAAPPLPEEDEEITEEWLREIGFKDFAKKDKDWSFLSFWAEGHNVALLAVHWSRTGDHYWSCQGFSLLKRAYPKTQKQLITLLNAVYGKEKQT